jgi:hypothetical protein
MDLKSFVAQTLIQIVEGVKEAGSAVEAVGATVNPPFAGERPKASSSYHTGSGRLAQCVEFDVALTVTEGTETKGGIGVFSGVVNLGSSGQSNNENVTVSRLKFIVPVELPPPK